MFKIQTFLIVWIPRTRKISKFLSTRKWLSLWNITLISTWENKSRLCLNHLIYKSRVLNFAWIRYYFEYIWGRKKGWGYAYFVYLRGGFKNFRNIFGQIPPHSWCAYVILKLKMSKNMLKTNSELSKITLLGEVSVIKKMLLGSKKWCKAEQAACREKILGICPAPCVLRQWTSPLTPLQYKCKVLH